MKRIAFTAALLLGTTAQAQDWWQPKTAAELAQQDAQERRAAIIQRRAIRARNLSVGAAINRQQAVELWNAPINAEIARGQAFGPSCGCGNVGSHRCKQARGKIHPNEKKPAQ